jgi:DNA polymerase-1
MLPPHPKGRYLLLIDASSYIHRAHHVLPAVTRRVDNMSTGALSGFCHSLLKLLRLNWTPIRSLPTYAAVICDYRGKNFRHEFFPEYKAQRKPYDAGLEQQLPWIDKVSSYFNVPAITMKGYEADDLIATYTRMAVEAGIEVVIASSDKDLLQFVMDDERGLVLMYDAMKDKGPEDNASAMIGPEQVMKKYGIPPSKMLDYQALTGDPVDNIPGAKGIGEVGAKKLMSEFPDVFAIIDEAEWDSSRFPPRIHKLIIESKDNILLSRRLAAMDDNIPVELGLNDLRTRPISAMRLRELFKELEFVHLLGKIDRPTKVW